MALGVRAVLLVLLAVAPAAPAGAVIQRSGPAAEQDAQPSAAFDTDGARVFLAALQVISRHHASALSDSVLWHGAANRLLRQFDTASAVLPGLPGQEAAAPVLALADPRLKAFESPEARPFVTAFLAASLVEEPPAADSALWERAIDALLASLDDPYSTVFTPTEYGRFEERNTGNYAGIGVQITHLGGRVTVTAVFREAPAEQAGMIVGDRIVWVDGADATEWSLDQARDAIRGPPGSVVNLQVERDGVAEAIALAIARDSVHYSAVAPTRFDNRVVYVSVDRIARGAAEELAEALANAEDAQAVVVDLRGNPGGYLDEALRSADLFLYAGQTLASTDARAADGTVNRNSLRAWSPASSPDVPLLVLVDEYTASAAEIVAGALQDHDRALVVGERTFGKGYVQTVFPLPAGRQISVTTGSWYTPLGRSLHRLRHRDGTLKPESEAGRTEVETRAGRSLQSGGGVFPDIRVEDALLKPEERDLLAAASHAEVSLFAEIEEFAFERAKEARATGRIELLPAGRLDELIDMLAASEIEDEAVLNPVARNYLRWRAQVRYLNRAGARAQALQVQAQRDVVLAAALDLAGSATTQEALFAETAKGEAAGPKR